MPSRSLAPPQAAGSEQGNDEVSDSETTTTPVTDNTTAPAAAQSAAVDAPDGDDPKANREAAKYRRRLRETEAERDSLAQRVERMQRAEVERISAERLAEPDDLWTFGTALADVLTDDGDVNADAVQAAVEALLTARPRLAKAVPVPFPDLAQGVRQTTSSPVSWSDAINPKR
jgi:hypothetical protein